LNYQDNLEILTLEEFIFDLQYFASPESEGRTEEPTEKKKSKAREKGQVAKSQELSQDIVTLACFFLLSFLFPYMYKEIKGFTEYIFSEAWRIKVSEFTIFQLAINVLLVFLKTSLPVMGVAFLITVVVEIIQVGWKISFQPLKPDFTKISLNPKKLLDKVFGKEALMNLFKSTGKVLIIGYLAYSLIKDAYFNFINMVYMEKLSAVIFILKLTYKLVMQTVIILLIFSICDLIFQRKKHKKGLMMTKQEVKDEMRQAEGDPLVKSKIRERQRQMSMRRMMAEVPKAEVVITNPTHLSVALKYQAEYMKAPQVVAKGADFVAMKIREIAKEHGVPLVENKPLAQSLYHDVEIGEEIPAKLYNVVAEVLSFVYRLKQKASGV